MKSVAIRFPDEMLEWLREKAAKETISRKARVSINGYVVELVEREIEADQGREG